MSKRDKKGQKHMFSINLKVKMKYINSAAIFTGSFVVAPSVNIRDRSEELQKNR